MTTSREERSRDTDPLGLLSLGFFLVLLSVIWVLTPNFTDEISAFFSDFRLQQIPFATGSIVFPAPEHSHPVVYTAIMQFSFTYAAFHIVILALRFVFREHLDRVADTISGMVFWGGVGFFTEILLGGTMGWFSFLAGLIISAGASIVASSIVKLLE